MNRMSACPGEDESIYLPKIYTKSPFLGKVALLGVGRGHEKKVPIYDPRLKLLAKKLRNNMTLSEIILWECLKQKQLEGYTFSRPRPIDQYIVDFYCHELKLIIEIDGKSHDFYEVAANDEVRQDRLRSLGFSILRFDDLEVKHDLNTVIQAIKNWIQNSVEICQ